MKPEDVYIKYLKKKGEIFGRGCRIPNDPELSLEKIRQKNQKNYDNIVQLSKLLNTTWKNIDLDAYFDSGFGLWKGFSYHQFLDPKVMNIYIQKDKNKKYYSEMSKKELLKSFKFILQYCKENKINSLKEYGREKQGEKFHTPVLHWVEGKICTYSLIWLLLRKYIIINDLEKDKIFPLIRDWSTYKNKVLENKKLFREFENKIGV